MSYWPIPVGESLFAKDIYPHVPLIHFCEYYYHAKGADADFDPQFPLGLDDASRLRLRNSQHLLNLEQCDLGITPTHWQHSLHPSIYHDKIRVAHEGIPSDELLPDPQANLTLPDGRTLRAGQPVVTYVARNLEPHRGFHSFMRALPAILAGHPQAQVVVVGEISPATAPAPRMPQLAEQIAVGSGDRCPQGSLSWQSPLLRPPESASDFSGPCVSDIPLRIVVVAA